MKLNKKFTATLQNKVQLQKAIAKLPGDRVSVRLEGRLERGAD